MTVLCQCRTDLHDRGVLELPSSKFSVSIIAKRKHPVKLGEKAVLHFYSARRSCSPKMTIEVPPSVFMRPSMTDELLEWSATLPL